MVVLINFSFIVRNESQYLNLHSDSHYFLHVFVILIQTPLTSEGSRVTVEDLSVTDRSETHSEDPDTWGPALTGTMSGICEEEEDCDSTSLLLSITSCNKNTHTCKALRTEAPAEWTGMTVHDQEKTSALMTEANRITRHSSSGVPTCWSVCFSSCWELGVGSEPRPCGTADLRRERIKIMFPGKRLSFCESGLEQVGQTHGFDFIAILQFKLFL